MAAYRKSGWIGLRIGNTNNMPTKQKNMRLCYITRKRIDPNVKINYGLDGTAVSNNRTQVEKSQFGV